MLKKCIACILTLCLAGSMAAACRVGSFGAAAETVSDALLDAVAETVVENAEAETEAPLADTSDAALTDEPTDAAQTEVPATDPAATADESQTEAEQPTEEVQPAAEEETPVGTGETDLQDAVAQAAEELATEPEAQGAGPGWVLVDGAAVYADIYELLRLARENSVAITLCTTDVIAVREYSAESLANYSFAIDASLAETCEGCSVMATAYNPRGTTAEDTAYLWIGTPDELRSAADVLGDQVQIDDDEADQLQVDVQVTAAEYVADAACTPTFTLAAIPELTEGMAFGVTVDDAAAQALEGNVCTPSASGTYRFVALDAAGNVVGRSNPYPVLYGTADAAVTDAVAQAAADGDTGEETTGESGEADTAETEAPVLLTEESLLGAVSLMATMEAAADPYLTVDATDYQDSVESSITPTFTLSGALSGEGYSYGISINGGRIVNLISNPYAPTESGEYTYVFYLLNAAGDVVDYSGEYHVILNYADAALSNEAYMTVDGETRYGTLASLLRQAAGSGTVTLLTGRTLSISDASLLDGVTLRADPDTFGSTATVEVSDTSPDGETGATYIWVGEELDETPFLLLAAASSPAFTIDSVSIGGRTLSPYLWVNGTDAIHFTITDPTAGNTYTYEVSTDGGSSYSAFAEGGTLGSLTPALSNGGTYDVVFRLTDQDDPSNVSTASYILKYDNQSPILICKAGTDNTLGFFAGDAISGFATDGSMPNVTFGAMSNPIAWSASLSALGQNVYTYSVQYKGSGTIPANTLGVRDLANNVAVWGTDITIEETKAAAAQTATTTARSSSSGTSRTVYHAASTYTTVTAYNGVQLVVDTGAMQTLTIGEQTLDLSLSLEGNAQADTGSVPQFHAKFTNWSKTASDSEDTVDTLVLSAADATTAENGDYCWTFDGSVNRKLAASGIDYMVFNVGDNAVAISTAGFTAGIRYNMYRASGLASGEFVYSVRMAADTAAGSTPSITVSVDGQTYALNSDQNGDFYYYNVYSGSLDMLEQPFGQAGTQTSQNQQG